MPTSFTAQQQPFNSVVTISGEQWRDSAIHIRSFWFKTPTKYAGILSPTWRFFQSNFWIPKGIYFKLLLLSLPHVIFSSGFLCVSATLSVLGVTLFLIYSWKPLYMRICQSGTWKIPSQNVDLVGDVSHPAVLHFPVVTFISISHYGF